MLIVRSAFICLLMIKSPCALGQALPKLILPEDIHGTISLNTSTFRTQEQELFDEEKITVFVKSETDQYVSNAIQGHYTKDGEYLVFKPYFPFEKGMTYVVRTKIDKPGDTYSYQTFQIGKKEIAGEAKVIGIYPTANRLPENLLRFYIYFNTPMKKGQALEHVKLIDGKGGIDNHVFMEFKQELWSADGKRLTLLFDPGRIKRGVSTNILRGAALITGKKYKLSICGDWEDVHGQLLTMNTVKEFMVDKGYHKPMKVANWFIDMPKANTNAPLILKFDRIIDHALIQSMIRIEDEKNNQLPGHWQVLENERLIRFMPKTKWENGNYQIGIDSRLEDITGNNLQNLLDHIKTEEGTSETYQYIRFKI